MERGQGEIFHKMHSRYSAEKTGDVITKKRRFVRLQMHAFILTGRLYKLRVGIVCDERNW